MSDLSPDIPAQVRLADPIKLVAVDLDGTLLNDSKQVSRQTVEAFCGLPGRGIKVVIASARPPRSVRHIYAQLKLDTWQINYNGALIWDEPTHTPVFHRPLAKGLTRRLIEAARDLFPSVQVTCEILDRWFTDKFDPAHTTETGRLFKPDVIAPLDEFVDWQVTKLMFLGPPALITSLEEQLAPAFTDEVSTVRTDDNLIQIMDRRVSKAVALQVVARHYGVDLEQVMAIGDAPNDVGMLQVAGVSVAMDNAHKLVKRVADWVAPSNNDHGVHAALVRYGLCE
ncbi:MAG: Cof-type HAD-IIB family hydrolase [Phycisphaerae bacterium]